MRYTFKDLVEMVAAHRREEFTRVYEYLHKVENPQDNDMIEIVSRHFNIPVIEIKSGNKFAEVAFARQVYMTAIKVCSTKTLSEVSRSVNKHHSTVCHALHTIKKDYEFCAIRRHKIRGFISNLNKTQQELLLDFLNERDPNILASYSVESDRVTAPSQYQERITGIRHEVSKVENI